MSDRIPEGAQGAGVDATDLLARQIAAELTRRVHIFVFPAWGNSQRVYAAQVHVDRFYGMSLRMWDRIRWEVSQENDRMNEQVAVRMMPEDTREAVVPIMVRFPHTSDLTDPSPTIEPLADHNRLVIREPGR